MEGIFYFCHFDFFLPNTANLDAYAKRDFKELIVQNEYVLLGMHGLIMLWE
jgi:hypothetical protein